MRTTQTLSPLPTAAPRMKTRISQTNSMGSAVWSQKGEDQGRDLLGRSLGSVRGEVGASPVERLTPAEHLLDLHPHVGDARDQGRPALGRRGVGRRAAAERV